VYIDPRTSEWRPAEPLSAGASSNPQSPATTTEGQKQSQKPRRNQEGMPPEKMMSHDITASVPARGGIPSLTSIGWRHRPGPQEHRKAEKGHPEGDPDLFPGPLDRPDPLLLAGRSLSGPGIASLFSGRLTATPASSKPQPTGAPTGPIPTAPSTARGPKTAVTSTFHLLDKPFHIR